MSVLSIYPNVHSHLLVFYRWAADHSTVDSQIRRGAPWIQTRLSGQREHLLWSNEHFWSHHSGGTWRTTTFWKTHIQDERRSLKEMSRNKGRNEENWGRKVIWPKQSLVFNSWISRTQPNAGREFLTFDSVLTKLLQLWIVFHSSLPLNALRSGRCIVSWEN